MHTRFNIWDAYEMQRFSKNGFMDNLINVHVLQSI